MRSLERTQLRHLQVEQAWWAAPVRLCKSLILEFLGENSWISKSTRKSGDLVLAGQPTQPDASGHVLGNPHRSGMLSSSSSGSLPERAEKQAPPVDLHSHFDDPDAADADMPQSLPGLLLARKLSVLKGASLFPVRCARWNGHHHAMEISGFRRCRLAGPFQVELFP